MGVPESFIIKKASGQAIRKVGWRFLIPKMSLVISFYYLQMLDYFSVSILGLSSTFNVLLTSLVGFLNVV